MNRTKINNSAENILNDLSCESVFIRKSEMTAGSEYKITISRSNSDKLLEFTYHTNIYEIIDLKECLASLFMDICFVDYDINEFRNELGYDEDKYNDEDIQNIISQIQSEYKQLKEFFTEEEFNYLEEYFREF